MRRRQEMQHQGTRPPRDARMFAQARTAPGRVPKAMRPPRRSRSAAESPRARRNGRAPRRRADGAARREEARRARAADRGRRSRQGSSSREETARANARHSRRAPRRKDRATDFSRARLRLAQEHHAAPPTFELLGPRQLVDAERRHAFCEREAPSLVGRDRARRILEKQRAEPALAPAAQARAPWRRTPNRRQARCARRISASISLRSIDAASQNARGGGTPGDLGDGEKGRSRQSDRPGRAPPRGHWREDIRRCGRAPWRCVPDRRARAEGPVMARSPSARLRANSCGARAVFAQPAASERMANAPAPRGRARNARDARRDRSRCRRARARRRRPRSRAPSVSPPQGAPPRCTMRARRGGRGKARMARPRSVRRSLGIERPEIGEKLSRLRERAARRRIEEGSRVGSATPQAAQSSKQPREIGVEDFGRREGGSDRPSRRPPRGDSRCRARSGRRARAAGRPRRARRARSRAGSCRHRAHRPARAQGRNRSRRGYRRA